MGFAGFSCPLSPQRATWLLAALTWVIFLSSLFWRLVMTETALKPMERMLGIGVTAGFGMFALFKQIVRRSVRQKLVLAGPLAARQLQFFRPLFDALLARISIGRSGPVQLDRRSVFLTDFSAD